MHAHETHPVQLVVEDDLRRNRLTVFFRLLLAIPHIIWITLWTIGVFFAAIANWIATLVAGTPPAGLHRFMCAYIRYSLHLGAYLHLIGNPYPGFVGEEGEYVVDVRLPPPTPQVRWKIAVRVLLVLPAVLLSAALGSSGGPVFFSRGSGSSGTRFSMSGSGALTAFVAFLGWFASLATGRMPKGLRDAGAYGLGYGTQTLAYLLLVTDRYPNADPTALLTEVERPPQHPVYLVGDAEDLRRSRLTVFFRILLAIPHIVWLVLWTIAAIVVGIVNWFVTLFTGTPQPSLHGFLSRYVRYSLHVNSFLYLAANPFPGFTGEAGTYPLDLALPGPQRQNRWVTGFRIFLAIPAWIVNTALGWALIIAAVYTWFVAMVRGVAPWGLRNLMAYALCYGAQMNAYIYLLTDAYPHASPLEGAAPEQQAFDEPL
jgi:Domain of unknown function (DUF4389)